MLRDMRPNRILVTAGPTREAIDPVRFLSNRSSGKMGFALAAAAVAAGQRVILVSGPVSLAAPPGARLLQVESAVEMRSVVLREAVRADVIIMAAAVADYQPLAPAAQKIKKGAATMVLRLKKTPDILAELGRRKPPGQFLVGFAAETTDLLRHARQKLISKNVDLLIANRVGRKGTGFEADDNEVVLLDRDGGVQRLPRMTKKRLARRLIARILARIQAHST